MGRAVAYIAAVSRQSRGVLVPVTAVLFAVVGVFTQARNPPDSTWALSSILVFGLAAWLTVSLLSSESESQSEMAIVALGGRLQRAQLEIVVGALAAGLVVVAFLAYPAFLAATRIVSPVFDPSLAMSDGPAIVLALAANSIAGSAVGALCAPPRIRRRATAFVAITVTMIVFAALGSHAGPVGVANALNEPTHPSLTAGLLGQAAACLVLAAAVHAAAWRVTRSR